MKFTNREKKIVAVAGLIVLGTAFLFFVFGIMFTTYNHVQLLGNINVDEINMDINETLLMEIGYKIAKEEALKQVQSDLPIS